MPSIFIEANPAGFLGVPIGADHLYLVYRTDDGEDYVIGGGPGSASDIFGGEFALDINEPIEASGDPRGEETPEDRFSTELNFPGLTADEAWSIMVNYARQFDASDYPYIVTSTNSNALVAALLEAAGVEEGFTPPDTGGLLGPVGYDDGATIVSAIAPPSDGVILGSSRDDSISGAPAGGEIHGEVIRTLSGEDVVFAGGGNDIIEGGADDDIINGGDGIDSAVFSGAIDEYLITQREDGRIIVEHVEGTSLDGIDTLSEVETLIFADATIDVSSLINFIPDDGNENDPIDFSEYNGNDVIVGTVNPDLLVGGSGEDMIDGVMGEDTIFAGADNDVIRVVTDKDRGFNGGVHIVVDGGTGYDVLEITGPPFSNREVNFSGQYGADETRVTSYSSFDEVRAFAEYEGTDKYIYTWYEGGSSPARSSVRIEGIEEFRVNGSNSNDDLLVLTGSQGQAFGNGNRVDAFRSTVSGDALWADWSDIDTGITWDLTTDNEEIKTLAEGLQVQSIERLLLQLGDGNDIITALGKDDEIRAGGGNDIIDAGSGRDIVFGEAGDDTITVVTQRNGDTNGGVHIVVDGGTGYDVLEITGPPFSNREVNFSGQYGADETRVTSYSSFDEVRAFAEYEGTDKYIYTWYEGGSSPARSSVRIEGIEEFRLNGSNSNDDLLVLTGSQGQAFGNGNRDGGDTLWADWSDTNTSITWDLTEKNEEIKGLADGLEVQGIERLLLQLGDGNDIITALGKDDEIRAGGGDDIVTGGGGNDEIDGGNGDNDIAIFAGLRSEYDIVETAIGEFTISHSRGSRSDGIDTLSNVEVAQFTDLSEQLIEVDGPIVTAETRTFSNGRVLETTYVDGVRSEATMTDAGDAYAWSSYTDTFDFGGARATRNMVYDDGREAETNYVSGVRSDSTLNDLSDVFVWNTIEQTFDDSGQRSSQINTYDNGRVLETTYVDGVRSEATMTDAGDAYAWSSYTDTFDFGGARATRNMVYDDGREAETNYVSGVRSDSTLNDLSDVFVWNTIEQTFDDSGQRSSQINTYDNGRVLETTYVDGVRSEATMTDADDAYAWSSYTDTFDFDGARATRNMVYDDGREVFTSYIDDLAIA